MQYYIHSQFLIKVYIELDQPIHVSLHPLYVAAHRLSIFHLACYEGIYHIILFLMISLMVLLRKVVVHFVFFLAALSLLRVVQFWCWPYYYLGERLEMAHTRSNLENV